MSDTTYTDFVGPAVNAAWLNDVNTGTYKVLAAGTGIVPTTPAAALSNLGGTTLTAVEAVYTAPTGASLVGYAATNLANLFGSHVGYVAASIASLRALDKTKYTQACITGYYTAGDGGGGLYWYNAADTTSADNGGTIIVAADGGRWYLVHQGTYTARQFGVKADGVTNDLGALNNAIAALPSWGGTIDCRDCQTILINGQLNIGNGTSTTASSYNGVVLLGAGGDDPFGNAGTTIKTTFAGTAVQFVGPMLGGGLQGNWIIDGGGVAINGLILNQLADGDFGNISIKNCTTNFVTLTNQNATDPYGGCRNNQFKSLSLANVPSGAVGLGLVAAITTSPGDIIQNRFGIVDMTLATNGATGIQLGWADFNVFDAVDISATTGGTSVGVLLKGNDSTHVPFNNTFNCLATSCPIVTQTGQIPYGNIILNYDFFDSNHVLPTAVGVCGTAQFVAAGILFSTSFGYAAYGWNNGSPAVPVGTGSGNSTANANAYPVTVYQTGGTGVHLVDSHGNDIQIGTISTFRLLPGEKVYFGAAAPTSWAWHADAF
jgi:hypothetical protein